MTTSSGLFASFVGQGGIFRSRDVLRPTYTPKELPHREEQIQELASVLAPALHGETPSNVLIYGKTGTGKTAVAKYVGKELEEADAGSACSVIYLNCEVVDTQYRVLAHLARHFDKDIPMTGWPTDQVYSEFRNALDEKKRVVVIMLDEVDKLVRKGDDVLYNLSRINSDLVQARVSLIGISNDLKFTEFLDPRVKSSLGEDEIIFPPYNAEQIQDILEQRAELAFRPGVLADDVIPLCAAFAAREHGDARRALDLLRIAGEIAERARSQMITEEHVKAARDKIEQDRVEEVIKTLPTQSKLVLYSILLLEEQAARNITTSTVYGMYKQLCPLVEADSLTHRRITDLIAELDMLGILHTVVISKGRYGRTKEISLSVHPPKLKSILLQDYRLKDLASFSVPTQARFGPL
ncbi:ORC1-type DNA replication protein [Methanothrix sp.]|uniref:ORC1-type DNA replication protein n=1 Tax=Methanothrix sp. TaxID=90426 RepID=UPI002CD8F345|nr:ORC1-type DNA replication protein [Methanothrix sp.]HOK58526.1 ORC1-type DNA replication protein [Methanothrix sp.]HOL43695.1 ORC1-type DNA replication protein [Methanothrix sp.]HPO88747.1 ORC1-type DNA replication protein [Methanothrix sp.]